VTAYIEEFYGGPVGDGDGTAHENGQNFRVGDRLRRAFTSSDGAHTSPDAQPSA
jgi:hypothetical protein